MVQRYLSGETEPPVAFLAAAAELLKVNFEWLAIGKGPRTDADAEEDAVRRRLQDLDALRRKDQAEESAFLHEVFIRLNSELVSDFPDPAMLAGPRTIGFRRDALRRFMGKLDDVRELYVPWTDKEGRRALLEAVAYFLVGIDALRLEVAQKVLEVDNEKSLPLYGDSIAWWKGLSNPIVRQNDSPGWNAEWYDLALLLLSHAVYGLGEPLPDRAGNEDSPPGDPPESTNA